MAGALIALLLQAAGSDVPLVDEAKEARAQELMRELRCVVCENEPISQSTADIAVDMRRVVRVQIEKGSSDAEVRQYFVDRYGQFVSFRPPSDGWGIALWAFPFLLLLGVGSAIGYRTIRARKAGLTPIPDDRSGETDA
ncbi:MAG: cytochrome c-type biogenesis protein CcmH [Alphaproteobacteria bacterium]|nr:MAG: cytochrome c-type biogenesis protein CcmH [Alphaproteobacteria bacterium]